MTEREIFGEALLSVSLKRYDSILKASKEDALCPPEHYEKMSRILSFDVRPPAKAKLSAKKKAVIALLIAALVVLAGCAAYVQRDTIGGFFVEIFDRSFDISDGDDGPSSSAVTEFYAPTYVPEGFEMFFEKYDGLSVRCEWKNSDEEYIYYHQSMLDNGKISLDNEKSEIITIEHNGITMIFQKGESSYNYYWNDGEYVFSVAYIGNHYSEEELFKIIDSVKLK